MTDPAPARLPVSLAQWASSLDQAENRAALADLTPDAALVVLPQAFARDFGTHDDELAAYAETVAGPFRAGRLPPLQHTRDPGAVARSTARSTSTTRSATASPTG